MQCKRLQGCVAIILVCLIHIPSLQATPSDSARVRRDSLVRVANTLNASGRFIDATRTFLIAGADTGSAAERFGLGMTYASLNDVQRASKYLRQAVALDSTNVNYRFQLARFLVQSGASKEGQTEYEVIVSQDSSYIPALTALGQLYSEPDSYEKAAEIYRRVLTLNPNDFLSHYYLANIMVGLVNPDTAVICLNTSLRLNPNFVPALNVLASIHYAKKRFYEALSLYRRAAALRPNNAEFMNKVGLCYRNLDDYRSAINAFRRAVELDSLSSSYFGNLGHSYYWLAMYDFSVAAYKHAVALDNENSIYYLNLALAYQRLDSIQAAANAYRMAIWTYHPETVLDLQVKLGSVYFLGKDYRNAIETYQTVLRTNPEVRDAQFFVASAYDNLGEYTTAIQNYNKYLKLAENVEKEVERIAWTRTRLKALDYLQSVKKK
jgi:tetratricopeptide (TPR) repeat protein